MKMRTESRKAVIVEAAASVFLEMGYEGASMNEVAKRSGGSKTTLYSYFPSKESLFEAVVGHCAVMHLHKATSTLCSIAKDTASLHKQLLAFGNEVLLVLGNDATALAVYRMVVGEAGRSEVGRVFHQSGPQQCIDALASILEGAMRAGVMSPADPTLRASQLLSLITAEANSRIFQSSPPLLTQTRVTEMAEAAVEMFLLGALPRESSQNS
jgi:AcrR family transcriptional regulator